MAVVVTSSAPAAGMCGADGRGRAPWGDWPPFVAHVKCTRFTASRKRHHRPFRDMRFQETVSGDEKSRKRVALMPASAVSRLPSRVPSVN